MIKYLPIFLLSSSLLSACGSNGFLARTEQSCEKIPPSDERIACEKKVKEILAAAEKQRAKEQADSKKMDDAAGAASDRTKKLCFTRQSTGELVCPN
jgi:hypothetical protein